MASPDRPFGPDRSLILLHFPLAIRPAVAALWSIDEAMGAVVADATQPALAAIKLAWWREALERLDHGPAPPEPRLRAVADELLLRGIVGKAVASIETGWRALLDDSPDASAVASRGVALFSLEAKLLGHSSDAIALAGEAFALGDAQRRGLCDFTPQLASICRKLASRRGPRALRPATLATRLALRDPREPEGVPARAFSMLRHRLTGRFS